MRAFFDNMILKYIIKIRKIDISIYINYNIIAYIFKVLLGVKGWGIFGGVLKLANERA